MKRLHTVLLTETSVEMVFLKEAFTAPTFFLATTELVTTIQLSSLVQNRCQEDQQRLRLTWDTTRVPGHVRTHPYIEITALYDLSCPSEIIKNLPPVHLYIAKQNIECCECFCMFNICTYHLYLGPHYLVLL